MGTGGGQQAGRQADQQTLTPPSPALQRGVCKNGVHEGPPPLPPTLLSRAARRSPGNLVLIYNLSSLPPLTFYSYLFYSPSPCTLQGESTRGEL